MKLKKKKKLIEIEREFVEKLEGFMRKGRLKF